MTEKEHVLAWANRIRAKHGLKPLQKLPKGVIGQSCQCPPAVALQPCGDRWVEVDQGWISIDGEETIKPPKYIDRFIDRFDDGMYPELQKVRP